ncbi:defensin-like protein 71 [Capsella rubella]|uniref:defensin-like protein 71 n=1 Tax=Capsella rubella TaxID=81985 RepID=UPI000CD4CC3F|nr:defensin-like protein 71 [Capsella rubella]
MNMTKAFLVSVLAVLLATSFLNSNALASSSVNGFGYDHCIKLCYPNHYTDADCKFECTKLLGYSDGGCMGLAPKFKCCCKK